MTSTDRLYALYEAVRYVVAAELPGAFVECGVWKGGSVMMMAATLLRLDIRDRDIYLFDTFAGMTPPTDKDIDFRGAKAAALLARSGKEDNLAWAYSPLDEVKANLARTGYPIERFIFVAGDEDEALDRIAGPGQIGLHLVERRIGPGQIVLLARAREQCRRLGAAEVDVLIGRRRHARKSVEQIDVAVADAQTQKRRGHHHHRAALPHAAFDEGARQFRRHDVAHGLIERVKPIGRGHGRRLAQRQHSAERRLDEVGISREWFGRRRIGPAPLGTEKPHRSILNQHARGIIDAVQEIFFLLPREILIDGLARVLATVTYTHL